MSNDDALRRDARFRPVREDGAELPVRDGFFRPEVGDEVVVGFDRHSVDPDLDDALSPIGGDGDGTVAIGESVYLQFEHIDGEFAGHDVPDDLSSHFDASGYVDGYQALPELDADHLSGVGFTYQPGHGSVGNIEADDSGIGMSDEALDVDLDL